MTVNIYLVEDNPIVLNAISNWVIQLPNMAICGMATRGQDALAQIPQLLPTLVLTDLSLQDMSGLELTSRLHWLFPKIPVLIMTSHQEHSYIERALAVGGRGVIFERSLIDIQPAITHVLCGGIYLSPALLYPQPSVS